MTTETAALAVLTRDVQQHGKMLERIESQGDATHRLVEAVERRTASLEKVGVETARRLQELEQAARAREEKERTEREALKLFLRWASWGASGLFLALAAWTGQAKSFLETLRSLLSAK